MADRRPKRAAKTAARVAAKPASKTVAKAAAKPAGQAATKAVAKPPSKPVAKPASQPASKAVSRAAPATPAGRLAGKVAFITGAAGNIGTDIVRLYLCEGAKVAMVGRDMAKLETTRAALLAETGAPSDHAIAVPMDGGDPAQVHAAIAATVAAWGRIDVLVNNAGSSGPKQRLEDLPLDRAELDAARAAGSTDTESVLDAARSLLGMAWYVTRAAIPHLAPGALIVNVTTIFSCTEYFGRAAYVVPKAAFNALSRNLALELGARGIRVNTVLPGPIDSERIRNVFAAMDKLRHGTRSTTAREFIDRMSLARARGGAPEFGLPSIRDVANAVLFLGSE